MMRGRGAEAIGMRWLTRYKYSHMRGGLDSWVSEIMIVKVQAIQLAFPCLTRITSFDLLLPRAAKGELCLPMYVSAGIG